MMCFRDTDFRRARVAERHQIRLTPFHRSRRFGRLPDLVPTATEGVRPEILIPGDSSLPLAALGERSADTPWPRLGSSRPVATGPPPEREIRISGLTRIRPAQRRSTQPASLWATTSPSCVSAAAWKCPGPECDQGATLNAEDCPIRISGLTPQIHRTLDPEPCGTLLYRASPRGSLSLLSESGC